MSDDATAQQQPADEVHYEQAMLLGLARRGCDAARAGQGEGESGYLPGKSWCRCRWRTPRSSAQLPMPPRIARGTTATSIWPMRSRT
jgi:hypothetical protein